MLKKIPTAEARLGMYLQSMEGAWLSHPFWKTKFVLTDPVDLAALKASGVPAVWIDVSKGADVAVIEDPKPSPLTPVATPAPVSAPASAPPPPPAARVTMEAELDRAGQVLNRSKAAVMALFNEARLGKAIDSEVCLPIVDEVASSLARNPSAFVSLARLKDKDDYTYMHSVAVCALMVALGRQIGMADEECRLIGLAGLVHDIGKALMPLDVLNKPGKLTDEEFNVIRSHPMRGHQLLTEGNGATPEMLDVVLHHHERPDGKGYPMRLAGEQLSRLARMGAICDVYDAITSNRPYKAGWDPAESIAKMVSWKGQFDENLLAAFVQSLGIYPTGSVVKLQSGRLAVVVEQNPGKLVAPVVKSFYSTKSEMRITPERIDLSRPGCHERIVARHGQDAKSFPGLDELWVEPEVLQRRGV